MAKRPSYEKFTITSIPDSASGGGFSIPDYEKDIRAIVNQAVKSALSEGEFFKTSSRVVDKTTGETRVDVYVHSESANVVADSLNTEMEKFKYRGGTDYRYSVSKNPSSKAETEAIAQFESMGKEPEYQRSNRGIMLKLLALVTSVVDITRRILSAVISFSTQTVKDMTTAHNYGMSYESIRTYHKLEKAHGMKEGTITEAVSDIQNKFGNITSLDEKALEALAVVMGGKIEEMATMGLGASNPEAVLGAILDAFNEKANAGYNSVGQYVGEQQARRELYSYLLKISPQVADIFATMQEEQHNINSVFRNQFETFEDWKKTINPELRGAHTPSERNITFTLGQEWNEVKKTFDDIKEHFVVSFAPAVLKALKELKDIRIGLSETQNRELNKENKEANEKEIKRVDAMIKKYGDPKYLNETDRNYVEALKEYRQELVDANKGDIKGNIHPAIRTPEEIRVLSNELAIRKLKGKDTVLSSPTLYTKGEMEQLEAESSEAEPPSIEDIEKILEDYNKFDLDKERGKYKAKLAQQNARLAKARKKLYDTRIAELEAEKKAGFDKEINKAIEDYKGSSNYTEALPQYASFADKKQMLEVLTRIYPEFTYDKGKGKEKDYIKALDKAVEQGYLIKTGKKQYDYAPPTATAMERNRVLGLINQENPDYVYGEQDFLYWLYSKNQGWFDKHIQGLQIDKLLADSVTGGKLPSLFMLEENTDWLKKLTDIFPSAYGKLYGTNDTVNGEVVHKIFFSVDVDGQTKTIDLAKYEGMHGFEGWFGNLQFFTNEKGEIDWQVSLEQEASEARLNQIKKGM